MNDAKYNYNIIIIKNRAKLTSHIVVVFGAK